MVIFKKNFKFLILLLGLLVIRSSTYASHIKTPALLEEGFTNAAEFGFSPLATGVENTKALQRAVDFTGTIIVSNPGTYKMAGTVYVGSNTSLVFGNNVFLQKVNETGLFTHLLLNKGALTKTYDHNIVVDGLQIMVNGIDKNFSEVYGLRGQIAFFYVKDLKIERFRCLDLASAQFGIHVCTFEDLLINDVIIKGKKDGIHLGRGKRFTIRDAVFETFDDAIALNAHDYATSNPELGWIEDGVVENCHDLNAEKTTGYFCRILAGAWIDWKPGMEVQQSDAVVSGGRIYRVQAQPDGTKYVSKTKPTHETGSLPLDGINWGVVQNDVTYTAGVRNVIFRDIFLEKPRIGFSVHFDNDRYSRSYYPGAEVPVQEQLTFDNIRIKHNNKTAFLSINTPMDVITITNSVFRNNTISFHGNKAMTDYLETKINIQGCIFAQKGDFVLVDNSVNTKKITLSTYSNTELYNNFVARVIAGKGSIAVKSDLNGLRK
jgi:polygalacturonase